MSTPAVTGRSKRAAVLAVASQEFGLRGYEATKWSTVAEKVGIGQPALYHYFESKAHCLLTIMESQLEQSYERHQIVVAEAADARSAVEASIRDVYDVTNEDLMRLRVLHANLAVLSAPRSSAREEVARIRCRELVRDFEHAWTALLRQGMDEGSFPERDPHQLAVAVLGLIVSVWSWFRPTGPLTIEEVGSFTLQCCLRMIQN